MQDPKAPRLRVSGLKKAFRRVEAVRDVSFEVMPGEMVGVIGPNGAGKSTTVKILTGQLKPDAGEVRVDGHRIDQAPLLARQLTGYVPQKLHLYPFLTGREVLQFVAEVRGLPDDEIGDLIQQLLEQFGLHEAQHRMTREYSEGMARKLAIAAALVGRPKLLVLDESLAGLDPRACHHVIDVIRQEQARGTSIVFVTHQLATLERLCQRVVLIDGGEVRETLTGDALAAEIAGPEGLAGFFLRETKAREERIED